VKLTLDVPLTPLNIAEAFAAMNDEEQAQFFVEVAAIMGRWGADARDRQVHYIAGHLQTCACATDEVRVMVRGLSGQ
jgi:hypothetical protein